MFLIGQYDSPFVRRVAIAMRLYGIAFEHRPWSTFGDADKIPGLVSVLAGHVKEVVRHANVISIVNEHAAVERWGQYIIKQKERIRFELDREKGKLVLRNIAGLAAVENGIEVALEKILVNPPKLEVTLKLGPLRPQRIIDIV